jgi:hypothetical protein
MNTKYMRGFDDFLTEKSEIDTKGAKEAQELSTADQIWQIIKKGEDFGVISAHDYKQDANGNQEKHQQLAEELDLLKLKYIEFTSGYKVIDNGKQSIVSQKMFFVGGIAHGIIMGLGEKYDQENIIFGNSDTAASISIRNEGTGIALGISGMLMAWVIVFLNPGTFPPSSR